MIPTNIARGIDRAAGSTLGVGLRLFSALTGYGKERNTDTRPNRILITKFWGVGNIVQAVPTIRAVHRLFPYAEITFLTLERNRGLLEGLSYIQRFDYLHDDTLKTVFADTFRLLSRLRKSRYDLLLDLDPIGRYCSILQFMTGAAIRCGFATSKKSRSELYTRTTPLHEDQHIRTIFLSLLKSIGAGATDVTLELPEPSESAAHNIGQLLNSNGVSSREPFVVININASDVALERRWPRERFAAVADHLILNRHIPTVFIGSNEETLYVADAIAMMKRPGGVNLAGRTNLPELVALLSKAALLISNDSGPLHIAAALEVPTISFFGPESPQRYGPVGENHIVFYNAPGCSPCISFSNDKTVRCDRGAACMAAIEVDEVIRAADRQLDARAGDDEV